jgi:excisionase family DNA binding protein
MPWMTTEEAARELGYHPNYIRRLLRSGRLEGRKYGTIWLVEIVSVNRLHRVLERQEAEGYSKNDPRRGE